MDAVTPLSRFLLFAGLAAIIGCQSDAGRATARGQLPQEPVAPPRSPAPIDPLAPIAPPAPPSVIPASGPSAVLGPAVPGAPIPGSPVPADMNDMKPGDPPGVVKAGYSASANHLGAAAELLKTSTPRVKVVAVVGANNVITDQEVRESVWQQSFVLEKLEGRERDAKIKELYTEALRGIIERELILDDMYTKLHKAKKSNVIEELRETASQNADRQIREIRKGLPVARDDYFDFWLQAQALTLPVLRRQLERQFMVQMYLNNIHKEKGRKVSLGEVRDYYDKHPDEFKLPDRVKWQHIFILQSKHASARAAYEHAEAIRQKIAAGADFAAMSKQYDNGLAAHQNGFGTGEKRGEIAPEELAEAVWSLKPGQVSAVIQTPTGFHLVKVVERDHATVEPFDPKVQNKIRDKLNSMIMKADTKKLVEDLWRKGVVRIMPE